MPACEGVVFVITAGGVAALSTIVGGLVSLIAAGYALMYRDSVKGRDNHIVYLQNTNADLTDIAKPALGVASGAVAEVRARRQTGRL